MTMTDCESASVTGSRPVFRLLWWFERDALEAHLLRLNPEDRYRRFGAHVSDAGLRSRTRRTQHSPRVILAAIVDGKVRGTVEIDFAPGRGVERSAEIALTVERSFRGQGMGSQLFAAGRLLAENRGADRLVLTTQADNWAMQRIARGHGMALHREDNETTALLSLQGNSVRGWLREAALHGRALLAGAWGVEWPYPVARAVDAVLLRWPRDWMHLRHQRPVALRGLRRTMPQLPGLTGRALFSDRRSVP
ncbi:MAG: GNAT family N-acetyltransferase [Algiphilus sp.]